MSPGAPRLSSFALVAVGALAASMSFAEGRFMNYPTGIHNLEGRRATSIITGDYNGDGHLDVVADFYAPNLGTPVFVPTLGYAILGDMVNLPGPSGSQIVQGDLDEDGDVDFVSGRQVLVREGDGYQSIPLPFTAGSQPQGVDLADDVLHSFAIVTQTHPYAAQEHRVCTYHFDGTTVHPGATVDLQINHLSMGLEAADFDSDGLWDFSVGLRSQGVRYELQDEGGGFGFYDEPVAGTIQCMQSADLDRDGRQDLVVGLGWGLTVLWNRSTGWVQEDHIDNTYTPLDIAIGDLTEDGILDVVATTNNFEKGIAILAGRSDGSFEAAEFERVLRSGNAIALDDFNGNGVLDVALATNDGGLEIYINNTAPTADVGDQARAAFRIDGISPNPAAGAARISFRLPHGAPTTLEVLDVAGRQVARQDLGRLDAGRHDLALPVHGLAPGVYLVRVSDSDRSAFARVAVVH